MRNFRVNKNIYIYLILLLISILLISCGPKAVRKKLRNSDTSLARVLIKKELVIGLEYEFPPFCKENRLSKKLEGYDIDLINETCKRLRLKPVFKNLDWDKKDEVLNNGDIDCIWSAFSYTKEREKKYTLSQQYIKTAIVIATTKKSQYKTLDDLSDKKIGVEKSSSVQTLINNIAGKYNERTKRVLLPFAKISVYDSISSALIAMACGEVDAVAQDLFTIHNAITLENKPYSIIPEALGTDNCVIAFKLGNIALKDKIDATLNDMAKTDFFEKTSKKWFGANISIIGR